MNVENDFSWKTCIPYDSLWLRSIQELGLLLEHGSFFLAEEGQVGSASRLGPSTSFHLLKLYMLPAGLK